MWLRELHRWLGLVLSPLILLTAVCGGLLLWRGEGLFGFEVQRTLLHLHNYEIVADYVGAIVAGGLVVMAGTGMALFVQVRLRRRRGRSR